MSRRAGSPVGVSKTPAGRRGVGGVVHAKTSPNHRPIHSTNGVQNDFFIDRQPLGAKDTFAEDIDDLERATTELKPLAEKIWRYCQAQEISGKTVTVKIKYFDFTHPRAVCPRLTSIVAAFSKAAIDMHVAADLAAGEANVL
jgi:nucleotidyltransferase/DNA polymerase involved in DNA repair